MLWNCLIIFSVIYTGKWTNSTEIYKYNGWYSNALHTMTESGYRYRCCYSSLVLRMFFYLEIINVLLCKKYFIVSSCHLCFIGSRYTLHIIWQLAAIRWLILWFLWATRKYMRNRLKLSSTNIFSLFIYIYYTPTSDTISIWNASYNKYHSKNSIPQWCRWTKIRFWKSETEDVIETAFNKSWQKVQGFLSFGLYSL